MRLLKKEKNTNQNTLAKIPFNSFPSAIKNRLLMNIGIFGGCSFGILVYGLMSYNSELFNSAIIIFAFGLYIILELYNKSKNGEIKELDAVIIDKVIKNNNPLNISFPWSKKNIKLIVEDEDENVYLIKTYGKPKEYDISNIIRFYIDEKDKLRKNDGLIIPERIYAIERISLALNDDVINEEDNWNIIKTLL